MLIKINISDSKKGIQDVPVNLSFLVLLTDGGIQYANRSQSIDREIGKREQCHPAVRLSLL